MSTTEQYGTMLAVTFDFIDEAAGVSNTVSLPVVTSIITDRTVFNATVTGTYQNRGKTTTTLITIDESAVTNSTRRATSATTPSQSSASVGASSTSSTSSSSSSSTPTSTPPPSHGLSSGAVAGVGIGSAIIGAAIAGLLVCLLVRRKQRRRDTTSISRGGSMPGDHYSSRGHAAVGMTSLAKPTPIITVERALEPPMQDSDILSNAQRLGTAIKNYAQSYYVAAGGGLAEGASISVEQLMMLLGSGAPVEPQQLANLLANLQSRTAAVRFLIAWAVLKGMSESLEASLLPPELAKSLAVIQSQPSNTNDWALMLSKWRQLTATLMYGTYGTDTISPSDDRQHQVCDLVSKLDTVLAPLASSSRGSDADRLENLSELVKRGARFQYTLFTQPTEWTFSWEAPGMQTSDLVVFPGLTRIADEKGARLAQPHLQGQAQVVNVGSLRASVR